MDEILKKETFKGSNLELLFESLVSSFEQIVDEETKRLMKEYSLSYIEARNIAFNIVRKSIIDAEKCPNYER